MSENSALCPFSCWNVQVQVTQLLRASLVLPESPSCLAASSDLPLLAGEVHSQQDVLLGVLAPVAVHHHHVAHAVAPHALQTHGLQTTSASLVLPLLHEALKALTVPKSFI